MLRLRQWDLFRDLWDVSLTTTVCRLRKGQGHARTHLRQASEVGVSIVRFGFGWRYECVWGRHLKPLPVTTWRDLIWHRSWAVRVVKVVTSVTLWRYRVTHSCVSQTRIHYSGQSVQLRWRPCCLTVILEAFRDGVVCTNGTVEQLVAPTKLRIRFLQDIRFHLLHCLMPVERARNDGRATPSLVGRVYYAGARIDGCGDRRFDIARCCWLQCPGLRLHIAVRSALVRLGNCQSYHSFNLGITYQH